MVSFKPYRGNDVYGHVRLNGVWYAAYQRPALYDRDGSLLLPAGIGVSRLGWGDTYAGDLSDFPPAYHTLLRSTLDGETNHVPLYTTHDAPVPAR